MRRLIEEVYDRLSQKVSNRVLQLAYRIYDEPQRAFGGGWDTKKSPPFFYADYL